MRELICLLLLIRREVRGTPRTVLGSVNEALYEWLHPNIRYSRAVQRDRVRLARNIVRQMRGRG